jgi:riboflavin biosynthesis pyrimidine reductase
MYEKKNILTLMPIIVTLVAGSDGSTSKNGNSAGVSTAVDRREFLARRRSADCIIIGGNTARTEPYQRTPVPVIVVSRSLVNPLPHNRLAHCWNLAPVEALSKAIKTFGPTVHIEAGASIIEELLRANKIDQLELSITSVVDGDDKIDLNSLLSHFSEVTEEVREGTRFISAHR